MIRKVKKRIAVMMLSVMALSHVMPVMASDIAQKTEAVTEWQEETEAATEAQESQTEQLQTEEQTEPQTSLQTERETQTETESEIPPETEQQSETQAETQSEEQTETTVETDTEQEETESETEPLKKNSRGRAADYKELQEAAKGIKSSPEAEAVTASTRLDKQYCGHFVTASSTSYSYKEASDDDTSDSLKVGRVFKMKDNTEGKNLYAYYNKGFLFHGVYYDVKAILLSYAIGSYKLGGEEKAFFSFKEGDPAVQVDNLDWVDIRYEFYEAGSNGTQSAKISGYTNFRDVDLCQGIIFRSGFQAKVLVSGTSKLGYAYNADDNYYYYFDRTGVNQSHLDKDYWLTVMYSGSAIKMTYTFVRTKTETTLKSGGGITPDSSRLIPSEHPVDIEKKVSDSDEKSVEKNTLSSRKENYTYTLITEVPCEEKETFYGDYKVTDQFDNGLSVDGVTVKDHLGADAAAFWNIKTEGQKVTAEGKVSNEGFYDKKYYFTVRVHVKDETDLTKYWNETEKAPVIKNQSSVSSDGKSLNSNVVYTKIPTYFVEGNLKVQKLDQLTGKLLSGAEFSVYEWTGTNYNSTPVLKLKEKTAGNYENVEKLFYTGTNKGKFKVVETKAPEGYQNNKWFREFTINGQLTQEFVFQGEEGCRNEPQWICVQVQKTDGETGQGIEAAEFTLYEYQKSTDTYEEMDTVLSTDEFGIAVSDRLYYQKENEGRFRVTETKTPEGYYGDYDTEQKRAIYDISITEKNQGTIIPLVNTEEGNFINQPQKAVIRVEKSGERLVSTESREEGIGFQYKEQPLEGAVFEVKAAEDIFSGDGKSALYKEGETVETITTDADGNAKTGALNLGTYIVQEIKAPEGFLIQTEPQKVALTYQGEETLLYESDILHFYDERPKVQVRVWKKSEDTDAWLKGAVFGLYNEDEIKLGEQVVAADTLIAKGTTDEAGELCFTEDLPIGYRYYVKELQSPENYFHQEKKEAYRFSYEYQGDQVKEYHFPETGKEEEAVFVNREVKGSIALQKVDGETGEAESYDGAVLKGAVYVLYAAKDIYAPDGSGSILWKKGKEVSKAKTDGDGKLAFEGLALGSYYIKEQKPSKGYELDKETYEISLEYQGQDLDIASVEVISEEPRSPENETETDTSEKSDPDRKTPSETTSAPKTGDSARPWLWLFACMVSGGVIFEIRRFAKRNNR